MEREISYKIVKELGFINEYPTGWRKELNIVCWNDNPPKIDIRDWNPDHEHMSRGITMTLEEGNKLYKLLKNYFESEGK